MLTKRIATKVRTMKYLEFVKKELKLIFSGTGFFLVSFVFSAGMLLFFRMSMPIENIDLASSLSFLWATHFISSIFLLNASQEWEWEWSAGRAIRFSGLSGSTIFFAKSTAVFFTMILLWILEQSIWTIFFSEAINIEFTFAKQLQRSAQLATTAIATSAGLALLGQLVAVMAIHSRYRHVLLLILFFPLALPIFVGASSVSQQIWQGLAWKQLPFQLHLVLSFIFFFAAAGIGLYDFLLEE